jgi:prophage DNA circulation protein
MASFIETQSPQPWRKALTPATFRSVVFHVEAGGPASGRRVALHEYPKREIPYAEDMGRRARRYSVMGYLIGPQYLVTKTQLIAALEAQGAGILKMPTMPAISVAVEAYSITETRERGGYCTVDMQFVEAGSSPNVSMPTMSTQAQVNSAADNVQSQASDAATVQLSDTGSAEHISFPSGSLG